MSGIPMSAYSWVLIYAVMWLAATAIFTILFSVGTGLGPKEDVTVQPSHVQPTSKEETRPVRHAA
jgi:hypothetical protein